MGARSPLSQAVGEVAVSDTCRMQVISFPDRSAGHLVERWKMKRGGRGVGVLKEECHLSLRHAPRNTPRLSTYDKAKGSIPLEKLILGFSSR